MTIGNTHEKYILENVWNEEFPSGFNLLFAKEIFRDDKVSLVLGRSNGKVKVHRSIFKNQEIAGFEKEGKAYETKGSSIQAMLSANVAKFSSEDILVGDSNGLFTIITNGQIMKRMSLCDSRITAITIDVDAAGNEAIVVGSSAGTIVAVTPYGILWKCRLVEVLKENERSTDVSLSITALHVFRMQSTTADASYVMVADSQKRLHFFQNGNLVTTMYVPSVITSMCSGYFVNSEDGEHKDTSSPSKSQRITYDEQVALATKSGAVFIFSNFNIVPYSTLLYPITTIKRLPASGSDDVDAILCCGHFNKLCILQKKKIVTDYETSDWVQSIEVLNRTSSSDSCFLVLGCLDRSVKLLKIRKSR